MDSASNMPHDLDSQLALERDKLTAEVEFRKQELQLKKQEQDRLRDELVLKREESERARWSSPLVLAIIGAALAGFSNAGVSWLNGKEQRDVESVRADSARDIQAKNNANQLQLETLKADSSRILEVIKTDDPDKAAVNLKFLVEAGLISTKETAQSISSYLAKRTVGQGPALPSPTSTPLPSVCPFDATQLSPHEFFNKLYGRDVDDKEISDLMDQVRKVAGVKTSKLCLSHHLLILLECLAFRDLA
jgi:hypothetical protein